MKKIQFNIRTPEGFVEKTGYEVIYDNPYYDYRFAVRQVSNSINSCKRWIITELSISIIS